ncbi:MAG: CBS domain-containing protein [Aquihabitans sp.]
MTSNIEALSASMTAIDAAERFLQSDIGAVPVCADDGHLIGMVTDRDLVTKVLAAGKDPSACLLAELAGQGEVVTIGADDSVEEAVRTMTDHRVRRLPVIDGTTVIGMLSQGDVAVHCSPQQAGELVAAISAAS